MSTEASVNPNPELGAEADQTAPEAIDPAPAITDTPESGPTDRRGRKVGVGATAAIAAVGALTGIVMGANNIFGPKENSGPSEENNSPRPTAGAPVVPSADKTPSTQKTIEQKLPIIREPNIDDPAFFDELSETELQEYAKYYSMASDPNSLDEYINDVDPKTRAKMAYFTYGLFEEYINAMGERYDPEFKPLSNASSGDNNQQILDQYETLRLAPYLMQTVEGDPAKFGPQDLEDDEMGMHRRTMSTIVMAGLFTRGFENSDALINSLYTTEDLVDMCSMPHGCGGDFRAKNKTRLEPIENIRAVSYTSGIDGHEKSYNGSFHLIEFTPFGAKSGETKQVWMMDDLT